MSIEVDDNIKALLEMVAGKEVSPQELADELGCSVPTVYRLMDQYAGSVKDQQQAIKEAMTTAAVEAYQNDEPVHAILSTIGVSASDLYKALRQQGIPLRKDGKEERDALVLEMYKDPNNTIFDIEVAVNRSSTYIYRVLHQAGVSLRRDREPGLIIINSPKRGKEAQNESR